LTAVAERFRTRAAESGRPLVVDSERTLLVEADRLRLEQAADQHGRQRPPPRRWRGSNLGSAQPGAGQAARSAIRAAASTGSPHRRSSAFSRADVAAGRGGTARLAIVETIAVAHGGRTGAAKAPTAVPTLDRDPAV